MGVILGLFQAIQVSLELVLPVSTFFHVELNACTPGLAYSYISHNRHISVKVKYILKGLRVFQNMLGLWTELHQVVVPYLEQCSIMDCTYDKELVLVQYVVRVIVLGIAHDLRHTQNGQVRTESLDWGIDTLPLSFGPL